MFQRVVLYFVRDSIYHILADETFPNRTICGYKWDGRARRLKYPYYDVKAGLHLFEEDGQKIYGHELCPKCAEKLTEVPKIPYIDPFEKLLETA